MSHPVARKNGAAAAGAGHPAPQRERSSPAALWFGLLGAPAAWSVQTLVNLPVASHSCFPRIYPLATPAFGGTRGIVLLVSLAALATCSAAAVVAWRSWQRTREEQQEGSGRGREHQSGAALLETGEGRTRFMALAGVMTSVVFFLVSAAHAATLLFVSPCGV
jgi:hypothetical protein